MQYNILLNNINNISIREQKNIEKGVPYNLDFLYGYGKYNKDENKEWKRMIN